MTDDNLAEQGQELSGQEAAVQQPAVEIPPAEPMISQSEVDRIVKKRMHDAAEKARRETLQQQSQQSMQQAAPSSLGGVTQMGTDEIRNLIAEEAKKQQEEMQNQQSEQLRQAEGQRVANEFLGKMGQGKERYPDFDEAMTNMDYSRIPHIVQMANGHDDTAGIMYELAKNPAKIANISMLNMMNPALAASEMQKLAASVKTNEEARQAKTANEPLSQIKPSMIGSDDGSMTVRDLRKQPWLRG